MPAGHPPIYATVEEFQAKVDEYFIYIAGEKGMTIKEGEKEITEWQRWPEPATVTGLALFLGFESRQSIYDYEERGEFSYIIKKARMRVECEYEKKLSGTTPTGSIFALKNMGWKDKTEQDLNLSGGITWNEVKQYASPEGPIQTKGGMLATKSGDVPR